MSCCEKCWNDAYLRRLSNPYKDQYGHYNDMLLERKDNPCSPKEQAGEYWDFKKQCDKRYKEDSNGAIKSDSRNVEGIDKVI